MCISWGFFFKSTQQNVPFLQTLYHSKSLFLPLRTLHRILLILIAIIFFSCICTLSFFSTLYHCCPDLGLSPSSITTERFVYLFNKNLWSTCLVCLWLWWIVSEMDTILWSWNLETSPHHSHRTAAPAALY